MGIMCKFQDSQFLVFPVSVCQVRRQQDIKQNQFALLKHHVCRRRGTPGRPGSASPNSACAFKPSPFLLMMFKVIKNYIERLLKLTNLQKKILCGPCWRGSAGWVPAALKGFCSIPGLARAQVSVGSPVAVRGVQEAFLMCSHIDVSSSPAP